MFCDRKVGKNYTWKFSTEVGASFSDIVHCQRNWTKAAGKFTKIRFIITEYTQCAFPVKMCVTGESHRHSRWGTSSFPKRMCIPGGDESLGMAIWLTGNDYMPYREWECDSQVMHILTGNRDENALSSYGVITCQRLLIKVWVYSVENQRVTCLLTGKSQFNIFLLANQITS